LNQESVVKNSRRIFASCCKLSVLALAALVGAACSPQEASPDVSPLEARSAWARPADSGATSAVYFVLGNAGQSSDTLTSVESSGLAATTEMHVSTQRGGMMHMSEVTSLPVPADDSVAFRPLGAHVMLTGLQRQLSVGDTVSVTLRFVSGRTVEVRAGVRQP
jgi:copper(I)-binding protein